MKKRVCMMCRDKFNSEWIGERICGKCRKTEAWVAGHGVWAQSVLPSNKDVFGNKTRRSAAE